MCKLFHLDISYFLEQSLPKVREKVGGKVGGKEMGKNAVFPFSSEKRLPFTLPRTEAKSPAATTFFGVALLDDPLLCGRVNDLSKTPNKRTTS